jgi:hypothetical protein
MTHDPLCFEHPSSSPLCYCELIAKVRADERNRISVERTARFGVWHDYDPLEGGH